MNDNKLLQHIYQHVLRDHANSDSRALAIELRMTEPTIDKALRKKGSAEYALLFEQLLALCIDRKISVDSILQSYTGENG